MTRARKKDDKQSQSQLALWQTMMIRWQPPPAATAPPPPIQLVWTMSVCVCVRACIDRARPQKTHETDIWLRKTNWLGAVFCVHFPTDITIIEIGWGKVLSDHLFELLEPPACAPCIHFLSYSYCVQCVCAHTHIPIQRKGSLCWPPFSCCARA